METFDPSSGERKYIDDDVFLLQAAIARAVIKQRHILKYEF